MNKTTSKHQSPRTGEACHEIYFSYFTVLFYFRFVHFVSKQSELYVLYFKSCDMNDATVLAGSCSALEASAVGQYADDARRCPRERLQNTSGTVLTCAGWTWCSQITNLNWRLMQHENKAPTVSLPTARYTMKTGTFSIWFCMAEFQKERSLS